MRAFIGLAAATLAATHAMDRFSRVVEDVVIPDHVSVDPENPFY